MADKQYYRDNFLELPKVFSVLHELAISKKGVTGTDLVEVMGSGDKRNYSRMLNALEEIGIVEAKREGNEKFWQPDYQHFGEIFAQLHNCNINERQKEFIADYTRQILENELEGTLKEKLDIELKKALQGYIDHNGPSPDWLEDLQRSITGEEAVVSSIDYVRAAIDR